VALCHVLLFVPWLCHDTFFVPWHWQCPVSAGFCVCCSVVLHAVVLFFVPRHCTICRGMAQCAAALRGMLQHRAKAFLCVAALLFVPPQFFWCRVIVHFAVALFFVRRHCGWCHSIVHHAACFRRCRILLLRVPAVVIALR